MSKSINVSTCRPLSFSILTSVFLLLLFGCKKPTEPPPPPNGPDTTSHNFIWRIDTLGDGNSSVLYDVAIIDENNIWAVGEVFLKDSNGQIDPLLYNVAQWDGVKWTLKRVTVNFRGNMITPALEGVFAFSPTEIWLVGSLPIRGNGQSWTLYDLRAMPGFEQISLSKAWGTSFSSMYFIGRAGSIVYYNGSVWQKIESGTTADVRDVWGVSGSLVLAVASSPGETRILSLSPQGARDTLSWPVEGRSRSIWVSPEKKVHVGAFGIWSYESPGWEKMKGIPEEFYTDVNGSGGNNIFSVSWAGRICHYNGTSWRVYVDAPAELNFESVAVTRNVVAIVGFIPNAGGVAVVGRPTH